MRHYHSNKTHVFRTFFEVLFNPSAQRTLYKGGTLTFKHVMSLVDAGL